MRLSSRSTARTCLFAAAVSVVLPVVSIVRAQGPSTPVVSVLATDSSASEIGPEPGTFTVRRSGGRITSLQDLGPLPFEVSWPAPPVTVREDTASTLAEFDAAVAQPGTRVRITGAISGTIRIPNSDTEVLLARGSSVGGIRVQANVDRVRIAAESDDFPRVGQVNITYGLWPNNFEHEHADDVLVDGVWMWSDNASASEISGRRIAVINCEADARNYCVWSSTGADYRTQDLIVAGCRFRSQGPESTLRVVDVVRLVVVESDLSNPVKHNYRVHASDCSLGSDLVFAGRNVLRGGGIMHAGMNANPADHIGSDYFWDNVMLSTTEALFGAAAAYIDFFSARNNTILTECGWGCWDKLTAPSTPSWENVNNTGAAASVDDPPAPFVAPPPRILLDVALTVNLTVSGTADAGDDYTALPASVIIPAGQSAVTVAVAPVDDTEPEGEETVVVSLAPGTGYSTGALSASPEGATVTIAANDGGAAVSYRIHGAMHRAHPASNGVMYDLCGRISAARRGVPSLFLAGRGGQRLLMVR